MLLAHGSLGWYDELIFLGVFVIFVGMMIVSWFRSRNQEFDTEDLMPQKPKNDYDPEEERFTLD